MNRKLLLSLVGLLVREELLLQSVFVEGLVGNRSILEDDGDAIVPTLVFGRVITGLIYPDLQHPAHFHFFLQQRVVILFEEL